VHQPSHEREDREEDCVPLQCSSDHLRADSGKGEEGEGQEVSIRPWADFTPERRQEVDITLWNKESAKPQTPHMTLRGPSQPNKQQLLE
ncbi:Uncharacterized protein DAT39_004202, partial [Clarias magur]